MSILDLLSLLHCLGSFWHIFFSILAADVASCCRICLVRNTYRISTKVCDHTYSTVALDVNTLIKLLCQTHSLLGGKIQCFGCLLLQGTGSKRKRSILDSLAFFHLRDLKFFVLKNLKNLIHLSFIVNIHLLVCSVEFSLQRLFLAIHKEFTIQAPVFFRDKRINLLLPVTDDAKCNRLHTAST